MAINSKDDNIRVTDSRALNNPGYPADAMLAALAGIDDGVIIVSASRVVEYLNAAAERIFRPVSHKRDNMTFIEFVRDYELDTLLRRCMETGVKQSAMIRMHQNNILLQITVLPDNARFCYVVVIKDLSEHQHLENIRRDLISNISHEFRTPIASIKLLAETMIENDGKDPGLSKDFLEKIVIEANKLTQMTDDLRELAEIEKGKSAFNKGIINIRRLIELVVRRLEAQAQTAGLKVEIVAEDDLPRPVIDGNRIESVLMNLVHNAIKFSYPGGKITIGANQDDDCILISVADTGSGIAESELERIFERFYMVDRSRTGEGSGLGLSISKHIVAAHGGRIWVESKEGSGSTFYFSLPLKA